jgi:DNA-3-methyladenine glycosylase II
MAEVIDDVGGLPGLGNRRAGRPEDRYGALIRAIVAQQVSTYSAQAIFDRLVARFGGRTPTPEEVLAEDPDELRTAVGLSRAKTIYLRSLAEHVVDGSLDLERLDARSDDEVLAELTAVKGIGEWSAQVFLIFRLRRPDVLAVGDLVVRKAIRGRYTLDELPSPTVMEAIAEPWRPHRSTACMFLWASLRATPV